MAAPKRTAPSGFTLIELMITLVVAGILAAIAYPAYTSYVQRSRRAEAASLLSAISQAQERYRNNRTEYARSVTDLGLTVSDFTPHYTVALTGVGSSASWTAGYIATVTPISTGPQATDSKCASMGIQMEGATLSHFSADSAGNTTSTTCWPR